MSAVKIRAALAGLAALLACALAGCSSGHTTGWTSPLDPHGYDGPLSSAASAHGPIPRGGNCDNRRGTTPRGIPETFADQVFTNYGHATVVLDRLVLLHPRNETLIAAYAIPGARLVGVIPWPPSYRPGWSQRQPIRGYRVAPGKSFGLVIGAEAAGLGFATSQGVLIYYHDSFGSYVAPNYFAMQIAANKSGKGCGP